MYIAVVGCIIIIYERRERRITEKRRRRRYYYFINLLSARSPAVSAPPVAAAVRLIAINANSFDCICVYTLLLDELLLLLLSSTLNKQIRKVRKTRLVYVYISIKLNECWCGELYSPLVIANIIVTV